MHAHEAPLRRLWDYADIHRRRVVVASLYSILNKLFDLAPPVLIGIALDTVVEQESSFLAGWGFPEPRDQILAIAVLTLVIWGFESLFEYLHQIAWRNLAQTIQHELRMDTYRHVQDLDIEYFEDRATGQLMSAMNDDVNQLERFLDVGANDLWQVSTSVVAIGIAFFGLAPDIAWMSFLPIPLIIWGSMRFQKAIAPRYAAVREQAGALNAVLANNLGGITTIKSFTAEVREARRVEAESEQYREVNRSAIKLSSMFSPLIRVAILTGFTATLVFGGFQALDGSLDAGVYATMVFMTQRLLWPLTSLGQTVDLYQRAMASTNRILDLLGVDFSIRSGPEQPEVVAGCIEFQQVGFSYDAGFPVLHDLSFSIEDGSTTAIVGATGAGKTTVIKQLLRLYDVSEGAVILDGHDLRRLDLGTLRRSIGFVSQDVFLFHGTVAENIAYGDPTADHNAIEHAAQVAEAHEFIESLPLGYQTIVGERGQKLSGGQRQRISIARAVLKNSPILVLDEATSAVDNETEAAIQRSLARISVDRTVVVIAHRLSTVRHAGVIHVLREGELAESGTHEQLLDLNGVYAGLWRVQTGDAVEA